VGGGCFFCGVGFGLFFVGGVGVFLYVLLSWGWGCVGVEGCFGCEGHGSGGVGLRGGWGVLCVWGGGGGGFWVGVGKGWCLWVVVFV